MSVDQRRIRVAMCGRALLLAVSSMATVVPLFGQIDPASSVVDHSSSGTVVTADTKPALVFDVSSIKLDKTGADEAAIEFQPGSDGITVRNLALEWIIDFAYDFERPELLSGLPEWAKTDKYDIVAKVSDADVAAFRNLNMGERRLMLRALLEDRFRLMVHRAPMNLPVYALVVGKNGVKMKVATPGDTYAGGPKYPDGRLAGADTLTPTGMGLVGQGVSMETLAQMLSKVALGREVVDETGLSGRYDFRLRFAPTEAMRPVINGQMLPMSTEENALPSVFTAVQEELGLRLETRKAIVQGLVVDHVERPSEN